MLARFTPAQIELRRKLGATNSLILGARMLAERIALNERRQAA